MDNTQLGSRRLIDWARQHSGVFTREQAVGLGMTDHQFYRGIDEATWAPFQGVFILAGAGRTLRSRCWAALFQAHPSAAITGPTALRLCGLETDNHSRDEPVFISVPSRSHHDLPGVVALRESRPPTEFEEMDGIPIVARDRAIVDTIRLLGWNGAKTPLFRGLQLGWVTPTSLFEATEILARCRGNKELKKAAAAAATGSHAESERIAQRIMRRHGFKDFAANYEVHSEFGLLGIVDIAFVEQRLAIEIDGRAWHSDAERFQRDRSRQNALVNAGWTVLRFTWDDLISRPQYVAKTVRKALQGSALVGSTGQPVDPTNLG